MSNVVNLNERRCDICGGHIEPLRNPKTGEVVWEGGHNAQPIMDGRCCDGCNQTQVIPARMAMLMLKPLQYRLQPQALDSR